MDRISVDISPSHVAGLIGVILSIFFLITQRHSLPIVAASIYFTLACTTDTFKSKVPNLLSLCLLIAGLTINTMALGTQGFLLSLFGLGLGISLLLLPYIMGGMGAGDVKALGALGALVGPYDLLHVFIYTGLYGGGLALFHYLCQGDVKKTVRKGWLSVCASTLTRKVDYVLPSKPVSRKGTLRFPYVVAIAFGYYSFIYWGGVL